MLELAGQPYPFLCVPLYPDRELAHEATIKVVIIRKVTMKDLFLIIYSFGLKRLNIADIMQI